MPSSRGLSPQRHQAIGPELARIREQLASISTEVMQAWPRRSVPSDRASAVTGLVDGLRGELDARFRVEHEGDYTPDAYYPSSAVRETPGMPSAAVQHALALKVAEARTAAEGPAAAAVKDPADQALRSLGGMYAAIAAGDAGEAERAMAMVVSWTETAQRESGTSS